MNEIAEISIRSEEEETSEEVVNDELVIEELPTFDMALCQGHGEGA